MRSIGWILLLATSLSSSETVFGQDPLPTGASLRLGTTAFRHKYRTQSLVFSPDGKFVAAPDENVILLWDRATGKVVRRFRIDPPTPDLEWCYDKVAIAPDGSTLVATAAQQSSKPGPLLSRWPTRLCVWDFATGKFLRAIDRSVIDDVCFSGDSRSVALCERMDILIWDIGNGRMTTAVTPPLDGGSRQVEAIAFLSKSKAIVSVVGGEIRIRRLDDLKNPTVSRTDPHASQRQLTVSLSGNRFATAGNLVTVHDGETGKSILTLEHEKPDPKFGWSTRIALSPDGTLLATTGYDGRLAVWEVPSGKKKLEVETHAEGLRIVFSPDGATIAGLAHFGAMRFWDARTGKSLRPAEGHEGAIHALAFSPDGRQLASAAGDGTVCLWDAERGIERARYEDRKDAALAWSRDGSILAVSGKMTVDLRQTATGRFVRNLPLAPAEERGRVNSIELTPDGTKLLVCCENQVQCWETGTGTLLSTFRPHRINTAIALIHDGKDALIAGVPFRKESPMAVWNLADNRRVPGFGDAGKGEDEFDFDERFLRAGRVGTFVLSPDETKLTYTSWLIDNQVKSLNVAGAPRATQLHPPSVNNKRTLACAPHGKTLAVCGRSIELLDAVTGVVIASVPSPQGPIGAVAFAPDGRSFATGGSDSTILVWRLRDLLAADADKADLAAHWRDLGGDPRLAYRAVERLAARPAEAIALLRENVKRRPPAAAGRIARLLADLDSESFADREQATRELLQLGEMVELDLAKLTKESSSPEAARRAGRILERIADRSAIDERALRAVLVLEAIASEDAIRLLEEFGHGAPGAALTRDARAATERIARRKQQVQ